MATFGHTTADNDIWLNLLDFFYDLMGGKVGIYWELSEVGNFWGWGVNLGKFV
ncbi:hypothetical protein [[Phormidium] sp. ETS-05]|uniref:hypothetical protein n=1 Tax=[Phormidium] sp. ETS-05 TaxID=222819 RepID=UPI001E622E60|nr:hypothetical protein [[Phormidium] sp. ETS-05]